MITVKFSLTQGPKITFFRRHQLATQTSFFSCQMKNVITKSVNKIFPSQQNTKTKSFQDASSCENIPSRNIHKSQIPRVKAFNYKCCVAHDVAEMEFS